MKWKRGRLSTNIEDRRGSRRLGGGGMKIGGLGIVLILIVSVLFGQDPFEMLGAISSQQPSSYSTSNQRTTNDETSEFVGRIYGSNEDVWSNVLPRQAGERFRSNKIVFFNDSISSACGFASAATGPFYCPADNKVYIDLGFFRELAGLGATGDFAQAYVIAHEVGHHIQNILGTSIQISQLQNRVSRKDANKLSVLLELQADCYAGIWGHYSQKDLNWLERGDIEEGIRAAGAIGDDRLQRSAGQRVNPDSFTHGSSKERAHWLSIGLKYGDMERCDTFASLK
jgi:predicted metalloprotease